MIERLRSQTGKTIIQYLMVAILASMALSTVLPPILDWLTGKPKQGVLVSVGNNHITKQDVELQASMYRQQIEYLQRQLGAQADMFLHMLGLDQPPQYVAVQTLMNNAILHMGADRAGIRTFANDTLEARIRDQEFAAYYLHPIIDPNMYDEMGGLRSSVLEQQLNQLGMGYDDLMHKTSKALQQKLYEDLIQTACYIPDHVLRASYLQKHTPRTFAYIAFDMQPYVDQAREEGVTDNELEQFFIQESKKGAYYEPEHRSGVYWSFTPETYGIEISDDRVEKYYNKHKDTSYIQKPAQVEIYHIFLRTDQNNREEVREKAQEIAHNLQDNPRQFKEKAQRVSEADDASSGGYIGYVKHKDDQYERKVTRTAFQLEDGAVSDPIAVEGGFEIIGRVSKKPAEYQPLEEVADTIRETLRKTQFSEKFKIEARAARRGGTVDDFVERHRGTRYDIPTTSQAHAEQSYQQALFQIERIGAYHIYISDNVGYIVRLDNIEKRHLPDMNTIREQVREDYLKQQAYQKMKSDIEQAYTMFENGTSLEQIAQTYQVSPKQKRLASEKDEAWNELEQAGLPTEQMKRMIHPGYGIQHVQNQNGCVVVLSNIDELDAESYVAEKQNIHTNMLSSYQNFYTQAFLNSLYKNAIKDDILKYSEEYNTMMRNITKQ